jgi:hypothetical protein
MQDVLQPAVTACCLSSLVGHAKATEAGPRGLAAAFCTLALTATAAAVATASPSWAGSLAFEWQAITLWDREAAEQLVEEQQQGRKRRGKGVQDARRPWALQGNCCWPPLTKDVRPSSLVCSRPRSGLPSRWARHPRGAAGDIEPCVTGGCDVLQQFQQCCCFGPLLQKKLAKKARQNRPVPAWTRFKTGNTIR